MAALMAMSSFVTRLGMEIARAHIVWPRMFGTVETMGFSAGDGWGLTHQLVGGVNLRVALEIEQPGSHLDHVLSLGWTSSKEPNGISTQQGQGVLGRFVSGTFRWDGIDGYIPLCPQLKFSMEQNVKCVSLRNVEQTPMDVHAKMHNYWWLL